MTKRLVFRISAGIGFVLILCKLCVDTCSADINTIQHALEMLEQLKPVASMNTVSFFYLCVAIAPAVFALCCGCWGVIGYASWKFAKATWATRQSSLKKWKRWENAHFWAKKWWHLLQMLDKFCNFVFEKDFCELKPIDASIESHRIDKLRNKRIGYVCHGEYRGCTVGRELVILNWLY